VGVRCVLRFRQYVVQCESFVHFGIAGIRIQEIRADEQQDEVSRGKMRLNFLLPGGAGLNVAVMPTADVP